MAVLRVIFGDQLTDNLSALRDIDPDNDIVLMMEVLAECTHVPHHKQKIVLVLSAMRHFAEQLRGRGMNVDYVSLDDDQNTGDFTSEIRRAVTRHRPAGIVVTEPSEWRVSAMVERWESSIGLRVEVRDDDRFFATRERFNAWAQRRSAWRMEHFYREMRREHSVLMDGAQPTGGQWNFDHDNRKALPKDRLVPVRRRFSPDAITLAVIEVVQSRFARHFGRLDEFGWPVTRTEALAALADFVAHGLPSFGDYQDAMRLDAPFLFHSLVSPALNLGLLTPREVCAAAETAFDEGVAPLNAVEGFIRQVLGWREYVRGVYWQLMPEYASSNELQAVRKLPDFYWTGETQMQCVRTAIQSTERYAYAHHIQRLMVTGNFALLAGIAPKHIEQWYLAVYADAFEWVEMPNTLGMAIFADGGRMASKPYAASGAYINRMSDACSTCHYDVKQKSGAQACPFNYLYWAFLIRNRQTLLKNPRMAMPYRSLAAWSQERQAAVLAEAEAFLDGLVATS